MIRRIQMSLGNANVGKLQQLDKLMNEAVRVLNIYVGVLWEEQARDKFCTPVVDTWLSARMQQCLSKQAGECVRSQRRKTRQTVPTIRAKTINLDQRFVSFADDVNSFDFWIKLGSVGEDIRMELPSRKHKHFNKYREHGWYLRKGARLRKQNGKWFLDVYMEKAAPAARSFGDAIGIDIGYKKLMAVSDGTFADTGMPAIYEKIQRKKRNSKAYRRALQERDNAVNRSVNLLDLSQVVDVYVEDLKNVKRGDGVTRKRSRDLNSMLHRWVYPNVLGRIQMVCETRGIGFTKINPAYTSQTCACCGSVNKAYRKGERFRCTACGNTDDADTNAARVILQRGTYSSPSVNQPSNTI
jgi:putative transposase